MKTDRVLLLGLSLGLLVSLLSALVLATTSPALASEAPDAAAALDALETATRPDAPTTWDERWQAYRQAKDAVDALDEADPLRDRYAALQPQVGVALRRTSIPQSGIIMGIVAALLLWGGFFFCLVVAMKSDPGAHEPLEDDETWPLRPE